MKVSRVCSEGEWRWVFKRVVLTPLPTLFIAPAKQGV